MVITPEQAARNAGGLAACREVVNEVLAQRAQPEPAAPLTSSEQIRRRALDQAAAQKRAQRMGGPAGQGAAA